MFNLAPQQGSSGLSALSNTQQQQPTNLYLSQPASDVYQTSQLAAFRNFAAQLAPQAPPPAPQPNTIMVSSTNSLMTASVKQPGGVAHNHSNPYSQYPSRVVSLMCLVVCR